MPAIGDQAVADFPRRESAGGGSDQGFGSCAVPVHDGPEAAPEAVPRTGGKPARLMHIRPRKGWAAVDPGELWEHRELLGFFIWRDVKVRYKQTLLGAAWAVLQPFATMLVFAVFFGRLAKMPSDGMPYPLFSFTSLLLWTYFAGALAQASQSVVNNQATIGKIYFPRLLLPMSAVAPGLLDLAIAFVMLPGMMAYYGCALGVRIVLAPVFVLTAMCIALGAGLWLSAINVRFRDVRHVVPFLVQFWLFASPVVFAVSLVPAKWRTLYALNPMVGVLEGFRWSVLGVGPFPWTAVGLSLAVSAGVLVSGLYFFRREERIFADVS
jgi:lipopolysaccharide transport system permease protein